jgi:hypothetical protein
MSQPQQSEALPLLKGLRIVQQEEVIPETTYPARTYVRQRGFGPCLVCGQETEYGGSWRYGTTEEHMKAWYAKQFETSRHRVHISVLNGTRKEGHLRVGTLEGLICETCRKSCKEVRDANEKERWAGIEAKQRAEDEWEKENERERERWDYHATWRKASRGEARCCMAVEGRALAIDAGSIGPGNALCDPHQMARRKGVRSPSRR